MHQKFRYALFVDRAVKTVLFGLLAVFTLPLQAQTWRSSLYPVDWTPPDTASFHTDKLLQDFSYAGYRRSEETIFRFLPPRPEVC